MGGKGQGGIKVFLDGSGSTRIAERLSPKAAAKLGATVAASIHGALEKGTKLF